MTCPARIYCHKLGGRSRHPLGPVRVLSIEQATVVGDVGLGFGFVGTAALACSSTIFRLLFLVLYLRGRAYDGTSQERSSLQVGAQYFCVLHLH